MPAQYHTHFDVKKTTKSIHEIQDKVADRLIIAKTGEGSAKIYFDYSDTERLEVQTNSEAYLSKESFADVELKAPVKLRYSSITDLSGNNVLTVNINSLIFDETGNYICITSKSDEANKCSGILLGSMSAVINDLSEQIDDRLEVKRID